MIFSALVKIVDLTPFTRTFCPKQIGREWRKCLLCCTHFYEILCNLNIYLFKLKKKIEPLNKIHTSFLSLHFLIAHFLFSFKNKYSWYHVSCSRISVSVWVGNLCFTWSRNTILPWKKKRKKKQKNINPTCK